MASEHIEDGAPYGYLPLAAPDVELTTEKLVEALVENLVVEKTYVEPGVEPDANPGVEPGVEYRKRNLEPEGMPDERLDVGYREEGVQSGVEPRVELGLDSEMNQRKESGLEPVLGLCVELDVMMAEQEKEPDVGPEMEPGVEPEKEPGVEPEKEPDVGPEMEPEKEPGVEPEKEPDVEPEKEPDVEPEKEPGVEPEKEPGVEPEKEPGVGPEKEPGVGPEKEPGVGPEKEPLYRLHAQQLVLREDELAPEVSEHLEDSGCDSDGSFVVAEQPVAAVPRASTLRLTSVELSDPATEPQHDISEKPTNLQVLGTVGSIGDALLSPISLKRGAPDGADGAGGAEGAKGMEGGESECPASPLVAGDAASVYSIQELVVSDPTWEVLPPPPHLCCTPPPEPLEGGPPLIEEYAEGIEDGEEAPVCGAPPEPLEDRCPILRLKYQPPDIPSRAREDTRETNVVRRAALTGPPFEVEASEGRSLFPQPRRREVADARGGPRRRGGGIPEFAF